MQKVEPSQATEGARNVVLFLYILYFLHQTHVGHPIQHGGTYELLLYLRRANSLTFAPFALCVVDPVQVKPFLLERLHEAQECRLSHLEVFGNLINRGIPIAEVSLGAVPVLQGIQLVP